MNDQADPREAPGPGSTRLLANKAKVEHGETVAMEPLINGMRATIARIEARG